MYITCYLPQVAKWSAEIPAGDLIKLRTIDRIGQMFSPKNKR